MVMGLGGWLGHHFLGMVRWRGLRVGPSIPTFQLAIVLLLHRLIWIHRRWLARLGLLSPAPEQEPNAHNQRYADYDRYYYCNYDGFRFFVFGCTPPTKCRWDTARRRTLRRVVNSAKLRLEVFVAPAVRGARQGSTTRRSRSYKHQVNSSLIQKKRALGTPGMVDGKKATYVPPMTAVMLGDTS